MTKRRALLLALLSIAFPLLLIEPFLRWVDPSGVYVYFSDFAALQAHSKPASDGARYTPGTYHFRKYSVKINDDGLRAVPASRGGDCRIAFVGDSVTFSMGSSVSFVDLLAPDIDATVINAGVPGYNAPNIAAEIDTIPADGYIYLIMDNDDSDTFVWRESTGRLPSAVSLYGSWLFPGKPPAPDFARFERYAASILTRADVLAFSFDGWALTPRIVAAFPRVRAIPYYSQYVSRYDRHPSSEGAKQIADAMRPYVLSFVAQQCP